MVKRLFYVWGTLVVLLSYLLRAIVESLDIVADFLERLPSKYLKSKRRSRRGT